MDAYQKMGAILKNEGFQDDIVETFQNNEIDVDVFVDLNRDDFKDLGITAVGVKKKLLRLIEKIKSLPSFGTENAGDEILHKKEPSKKLENVEKTGDENTVKSEAQKEERQTSMHEIQGEHCMQPFSKRNSPMKQTSEKPSFTMPPGLQKNEERTMKDESGQRRTGNTKCQNIAQTPKSFPTVEHPLMNEAFEEIESTAKMEGYIGFSSTPDLEIIENLPDNVKKKMERSWTTVEVDNNRIKAFGDKTF